MKKLLILLLLCCLLFAASLGRHDPSAGVCAVCGARVDEGKSLCDDCAKAQLDGLEQTEQHSVIVAFD